MPKPPKATEVFGEIARIPLTKDAYAIVDASDLPLVSGKNWHLDSKGYARTSLRNPARPKAQFKPRLHRILLDPPPGTQVDHINGDRLDNRRSNLRPCTGQQNQMNRAKRPGSASQFKGVYFHRRASKWFAAIQLDGRLRYLGLFANEEEAARTYDRAASELFGEFARLNFPTAREDRSSSPHVASPLPYSERTAPLS